MSPSQSSDSGDIASAVDLPAAAAEGEAGGAGLYIHIPFCSSICPYCDFAVRRGGEESVRRLISTLLREIEALAEAEALPEAPPLASAVSTLVKERFDTIYFGGGTPSLVGDRDLERILSALGRHLDIDPEARLFFEANPEHVSPERVAAWRELGVKTLSLGVQALDDRALGFLGRGHDTREALRAIEIAREGGFATLSVDLIYGLPDQTEVGWDRQLEIVLDQRLDHLSLYELEIHGRTDFGRRFARGELDPLAEDARAALFLATHERMIAAGWDGYEVSSFARRRENRSQHNGKYWRHVPYLGLGPSSHSLAVDPDFGLWRYWNERLEPRWRRQVEAGRSPAEGWERLSPSAIALEMAMLGLRTRDGLDLSRMLEMTDIDLLAK
ncbi:MAG: coproporphyrinogen-III oxidase family protein, partial [Acidobacteriota bacterium]